jgi:hypothetical protein
MVASRLWRWLCTPFGDQRECTARRIGHHAPRSFRRSRGILHTPSEEHPSEQSVFSGELVVERGKHVQDAEAGKERRNIAVRHPGRINQEGRR